MHIPCSLVLAEGMANNTMAPFCCSAVPGTSWKDVNEKCSK